MKDLTITKRFAIIALNGVRSSEYNTIRHLKGQCLAAACIAEGIIDGQFKVSDGVYSPLESAKEQPCLSIVIKNCKKTGSGTFSEWMDVVTSLGKKACQELDKVITTELIEENLLDDIPALLACDLNYETAGVKIREYRSSLEQYHGEIDLLRSEILEGGPLSDEAACLLWLFSQSGDLEVIFARAEMEQVQTVRNQLYRTGGLWHHMYETNLGNAVSKLWSSFLKMKKELAQSQTGVGFVSRIPVLQPDEAIFIATEEWFPNAGQRLLEVKNVLESNGHICEIKASGSVSLMEIDNVLYELIPDAVSMKYSSIHGVRLRRYLM